MTLFARHGLIRRITLSNLISQRCGLRLVVINNRLNIFKKEFPRWLNKNISRGVSFSLVRSLSIETQMHLPLFGQFYVNNTIQSLYRIFNLRFVKHNLYKQNAVVDTTN